MFCVVKKYELGGGKGGVRLFKRFGIERVVKMGGYERVKFGSMGKLGYVWMVIEERVEWRKGKGES